MGLFLDGLVWTTVNSKFTFPQKDEEWMMVKCSQIFKP